MIILYFLLFIIIAGPGIYLGENLITPTDLFIPILFIATLRRQFKVLPVQKYLLFYIITIIISLYIGYIFENGIDFSSVLKGIRFSYVVFIPSIIHKYLKRGDYNENQVLRFTMLSGIASGLVGIILFISQSTLYQAPEKFIFLGNYIYRAGGVFAEANYFGFAMSVLCMIAIECVFHRRFISISLILVAVCGFGIVISDSRSALLSIAVALIFRYWNFTKMRNIKITIALIIGLCIAYMSIPTFKDYIDGRIFAIFISYIDNGDINSVSSGRLNVWLESIDNYINGNILEILFGTGYKSETLNIFSDNSYISTLVTMGIFGTIAFIVLWVYLKRVSKKFDLKNSCIFNKIFKSFITMFLVNMLFLDSMTFTRMIYLLIVIYTICFCIVESPNEGY